jgi:hypothetical protein
VIRVVIINKTKAAQAMMNEIRFLTMDACDRARSLKRLRQFICSISARHWRPLIMAVAWAGCLPSSGAAMKTALEPIQISQNGRGFVLGETGRPFLVWGVNYDHNSKGGHGRLLEDYWVEEWDMVQEDFQQIKALGANVARIHLQLAKFMDAPDQPNQEALTQLRRLLELAEQTGLYLNLTGLGCYHKQDVPEWYDQMDEAERWEAQARFWSAVAKVCHGSSAVFCYNLMNEPIIGGSEPNEWLTGELGGKHFVQRLTLTPGNRAPREIAKAWVEKLTAAIRQQDPDHLITVGVIPWALIWPNAKPIFYAPEVSSNLDFVSVHFYPRKGEVEKALAALAVYDIGKPLVIEEMFPLHCSVAELDESIQKSRQRVAGYLSFYWGKTIEEYEEEKTLKSALAAAWLKYFRQQAETMKRPLQSER